MINRGYSMAKKSYYSVKASKGNLGDTIDFEKNSDNMICIYGR